MMMTNVAKVLVDASSKSSIWSSFSSSHVFLLYKMEPVAWNLYIYVYF